MNLSEYQKKRDFKSTTEPEGGASKNEFLVFVVQKHLASRLHYDLRIEHKGVLKSWAVPKGPSLDPGVKRLAMMTEDHPYDYRTFEGTIPKGNYGAGEVIVWDEGNFALFSGGSKEEMEKKISEGLEKGHLTLIFNGKKMKGEFALVKTTAEENSWMLVKKNDEYARVANEKDILSEDHSVLSPVRLGNERADKLEIVPERIDRAKRSDMPHRIKPMLATRVEKPFDHKDWIFEIKWDGYRAIAEISKKGVTLRSRNLNDLTKMYGPVVSELRKIKHETVIDGEVVILDKEGKPNFQALQDYEQKGGFLAYMAFDLIYYEGYDLRDTPLFLRRKLLRYILPDSPVVRFSDSFDEKGIDFFEVIKDQGIEGVIGKERNSIYIPAHRSAQWLKVKAILEEEAVICGYTEPRGGRKHFGALLLGVYKNDELKYVGHVGTGFDDRTLIKIKNILDKLRRVKSPFEKVPISNTPVQWVKPEIVCQVKYSEMTNEDIMRHPVFLGLRGDKNATEVGPEKVMSSYEKASGDVEIPKARITNQGKIFWPEEKITKGELISYYEEISGIILPYLQGRPQNLNRFPDGINGESFYQKNAANVPKWVRTIKISSETEERDIKYILCNDKETLLYLVNLGCIEINPWNSRIPHLEKPDYLIIDLDPEDMGFEKVVDAALIVKEIFDELEIPSYCKTSGATGLHIYVPLGAKYTYAQVRQFSEIIANIAHSRSTRWTSIVRDPKKRQGKVYLDFLQNRMGQTLAAPYCVRPMPQATVSMPLEWDEVHRGLRPTDFTIKNALKRIREKGDLWGHVLGTGISIEKSLQRLQGKFSDFI